MKKKIFVQLLLYIIALSSGCANAPNNEFSQTLTGELGTVSTVTVYDSESALSECIDYIRLADSRFSVTNPESEISRLNNGENIALSTDTEEILELSKKYADDTFNPHAGELFSLWDEAIKSAVLPDDAEISKAKSDIGKKVNLGAIAKGYITDRLVEILDREKVDSALINLGGNIYAKGKKPNGKPWQIGVRTPDEPDSYVGIISAENLAVVTSGDYERYFDADGIRYHHIIDPKTGYPAKSGLRSVTIISDNATIADMLSTKCFILGFEASMPILDEFGVAAIFITDKNEVLYSAGLEDIFTFDNPSFSYKTF